MNLKRCSKGHFYDVDKYSSCPHCAEAAGAGDDIGATVSFSAGGQQGATLPPTEAYTDTVAQTEYDTIPEPDNTSALSAFLKKNTSAGEASRSQDDEGVTVSYTPGNLQTEPVVGWLVCITGENAGESRVLKTGRNFIGRSPSMDVVLSGDKSISREKHAIVLYEPRKREFLVQPGDSRELFYLNDDVVLSTTKLAAYDKLLIGNTELLFIPFCGAEFAWEDLDKKDE